MIHNGQMGVFYLEEAVLDVLFKTRIAGEHLAPASISRRAGIPGDRDPGGVQFYSIATGILRKLEIEDRVQRPEQPAIQGEYEITDTEFSRREEIV